MPTCVHGCSHAWRVTRGAFTYYYHSSAACKPWDWIDAQVCVYACVLCMLCCVVWCVVGVGAPWQSPAFRAEQNDWCGRQS